MMSTTTIDATQESLSDEGSELVSLRHYNYSYLSWSDETRNIIAIIILFVQCGILIPYVSIHAFRIRQIRHLSFVFVRNLSLFYLNILFGILSLFTNVIKTVIHLNAFFESYPDYTEYLLFISIVCIQLWFCIIFIQIITLKYDYSHSKAIASREWKDLFTVDLSKSDKFYMKYKNRYGNASFLLSVTLFVYFVFLLPLQCIILYIFSINNDNDNVSYWIFSLLSMIFLLIIIISIKIIFDSIKEFEDTHGIKNEIKIYLNNSKWLLFLHILIFCIKQQLTKNSNASIGDEWHILTTYFIETLLISICLINSTQGIIYHNKDQIIAWIKRERRKNRVPRLQFLKHNYRYNNMYTQSNYNKENDEELESNIKFNTWKTRWLNEYIRAAFSPDYVETDLNPYCIKIINYILCVYNCHCNCNPNCKCRNEIDAANHAQEKDNHVKVKFDVNIGNVRVNAFERNFTLQDILADKQGFAMFAQHVIKYVDIYFYNLLYFHLLYTFWYYFPTI